MIFDIYELQFLCDDSPTLDYIVLKVPVSSLHKTTGQNIDLGAGIVGKILMLGSIVAGSPTHIKVNKQQVIDFIDKYKKIHQLEE